MLSFATTTLVRHGVDQARPVATSTSVTKAATAMTSDGVSRGPAPPAEAVLRSRRLDGALHVLQNLGPSNIEHSPVASGVSAPLRGNE